MEGFLPVQNINTSSLTDQGQVDTKYVLSGDPVTQSAGIDGVQLPPGDRRMVMASGPFRLNLGDSATVVLGN